MLVRLSRGYPSLTHPFDVDPSARGHWMCGRYSLETDFDDLGLRFAFSETRLSYAPDPRDVRTYGGPRGQPRRPSLAWSEAASTIEGRDHGDAEAKGLGRGPKIVMATAVASALRTTAPSTTEAQPFEANPGFRTKLDSQGALSWGLLAALVCRSHAFIKSSPYGSQRIPERFTLQV